jgi:hypothetical protein
MIAVYVCRTDRNISTRRNYREDSIFIQEQQIVCGLRKPPLTQHTEARESTQQVVWFPYLKLV